MANFIALIVISKKSRFEKTCDVFLKTASRKFDLRDSSIGHAQLIEIPTLRTFGLTELDFF